MLFGFGLHQFRNCYSLENCATFSRVSVKKHLVRISLDKSASVLKSPARARSVGTVPGVAHVWLIRAGHIRRVMCSMFGVLLVSFIEQFSA
jgi:hypothetical protein